MSIRPELLSGDSQFREQISLAVTVLLSFEVEGAWVLQTSELTH